jgi:hypothetical protein
MEYDPVENTQVWHDPTEWKTSVTRLMAITETPDSTLWIGTDVGLVHYDPESQQLITYTKKDGLPDNFVCGLLPQADSCLWLSTNRGLARFHIPSESFINFFEEDGITHNEFNRLSFYKAGDGRMYFGGLRGITAFHPDTLMQEFKRRNEAAQVALTSLEYIDDKLDSTLIRYYFGKGEKIELWHHLRSFTFEYVLTDFRNPEAVFYSYQMDGYEDSWSAPSNINFIRYNSLPPGNYTFRVKARDSHGLWHPNELAIPVVVHPPWWQTVWAYAGYVLLFCGFIYLIYFVLQRRLLLRNELKKQRPYWKQLITTSRKLPGRLVLNHWPIFPELSRKNSVFRPVKPPSS